MEIILGVVMFTLIVLVLSGLIRRRVRSWSIPGM